eukprot:GHVU01141151.1.p2 GENE.GHVU01141151.1~~GHVU01141151.1.p2  ORF type:complete len:274 (+),score=42.79 GHVU01141151.1:260-1081(+)
MSDRSNAAWKGDVHPPEGRTRSYRKQYLVKHDQRNAPVNPQCRQEHQHLESAKIVEVRKQEGGPETELFLDRSIFHPQGGGQPADVGRIVSKRSGAALQVTAAKLDQHGRVVHVGLLDGEKMFELDEEVEMSIDAAKRDLHARLHSAGHLIDVAVKDKGLPWKPAKGFHFQCGPYVEYVYAGSNKADPLAGAAREELSKELEAACAALIAERVPLVVDNDNPRRTVSVGGVSCECGGTHVADAGELITLSVRKIEPKRDGHIRVKYEVAAPQG